MSMLEITTLRTLTQRANALLAEEYELYGFPTAAPVLTPAMLRAMFVVVEEHAGQLMTQLQSNQVVAQMAPAVSVPSPKPDANLTAPEPAWQGDEGTPVPAYVPPGKRRQRAPQVNKPEIVAAIKAMAVNGKMPPQNYWDRHRPDGYPNYTAIKALYGMNWNQIAFHIGLEANATFEMRRPRGSGKEAEGAETPAPFPVDADADAADIHRATNRIDETRADSARTLDAAFEKVYSAAENLGKASVQAFAKVNATLTESTRSTLGPEHTVVTPYRSTGGN